MTNKQIEAAAEATRIAAEWQRITLAAEEMASEYRQRGLWPHDGSGTEILLELRAAAQRILMKHFGVSAPQPEGEPVEHKECGWPWIEHVCPDSFDSVFESLQRLRANPMPKPPNCDHPERPNGKPLCQACWDEYRPKFEAWAASRKNPPAPAPSGESDHLPPSMWDGVERQKDRHATNHRSNRTTRQVRGEIMKKLFSRYVTFFDLWALAGFRRAALIVFFGAPLLFAVGCASQQCVWLTTHSCNYTTGFRNCDPNQPHDQTAMWRGAEAACLGEQENRFQTIKWTQLAVDGFTEVYRSDDSRWQIEPARIGQHNDGTGWCLLDRGKHPITEGEDFDYVQCGTLAEMKMQAESLKAWRP
jgi:hypothetical protein